MSIHQGSCKDTRLFVQKRTVHSLILTALFRCFVGGGTVTLVNDGLKRTAARLIYGLPAADGDGWVACDDDTAIPYVGIGYIKRYMEEGVTSWVPVVLKKCKFQMFGDDAATQEEEIDWQTQELTATVMRDDSAKHCWRLLGNEYASEALAEAALKAALDITP